MRISKDALISILVGMFFLFMGVIMFIDYILNRPWFSAQNILSMDVLAIGLGIALIVFGIQGIGAEEQCQDTTKR